MKYSKHQITEAIAYWKRQLKILNERRMSRDEYRTFLDQLTRGEVVFEYMKKERDAQGNPTGRLVNRHARGTRKRELIPAAAYTELQQLLNTPRAAYMVYYYDLDSNGIRQFNCNHYERTISAPRAFRVSYDYWHREQAEIEITAADRDAAIQEFNREMDERFSDPTYDKDPELVRIDAI